MKSWVESANDPAGDFPIENLPYGRFRRDRREPWRVGVAIGDQILDLRMKEDLNAFMARGPGAWRLMRRALTSGLEFKKGKKREWSRHLVARRDVEMGLPCAIGDYTDFYAGIHHATRIGKLFRPDSPLLPNYKWVPIGYHGRASSIVVSGTPITRPAGQLKTGDTPMFGPASTTRSSSVSWSVPGTRWGSPSTSGRRKSTFSASYCSTTGRRATSRRGNTSRSGRSCRRTSRRPCRRGW